MTGTPAIGSQRLHHLDGLRGVASLIVVLHHHIIAFDSALYFGLPEQSRFPGDIWLSQLPLAVSLPGNLAVSIFFILSGYVLAPSFSRSPLGPAALTVKRYVRLGLLIFLVSLFAWALTAMHAATPMALALQTRSAWLLTQLPAEPNLMDAVMEGLYGALFAGHASYNSSLWTMQTELLGSLVLIVIFTTFRVLPLAEPWRARVTGVVLIAFALATHGSYVALFGVGAAFYLFDVRAICARIGRAVPVIIGLVVIGTLLGNVSYSAARPGIVTWFVSRAPTGYSVSLGRGMDGEDLWHACGAVMLVLAIDLSPTLRHFFSGPRFRFLGDISFPLYLVHVPVLLAVGARSYLLLVGWETPVVLATLLASLVSIGTSIFIARAVTRYVEQPAIRWANVAGELTQAWIESPIANWANRLVRKRRLKGAQSPARD